MGDPRVGGTSFGPGGGGLFDGGVAAMRKSEEEMMRHAMMLSIHEASSSRKESPPQISKEALKQGIEGFEAVTGVNGATAQYYVEFALAQGENYDFAIQRYFD